MPAPPCAGEKKQELLFVNKKKQKNFNHFWPVALERPREAEQKFFGSFFQKRTPCFYLFFNFWTAWELPFCSQKDVLASFLVCLEPAMCTP
jgi:hypothetical protein